MRYMTVPLFAAFVFGLCGLLAAASVEFLLHAFADDVGMSRLLFASVPGLFAMMWALLVYRKAELRVERVGQSISRGILVALLTWISFSALATGVWCRPAEWGTCFGHSLLVSGIIGGGPMLVATLVAGAIVGWLIKQRKLHWIMED